MPQNQIKADNPMTSAPWNRGGRRGTGEPPDGFPLPVEGNSGTLGERGDRMKFTQEPGRIFAQDESGKLLAEVTFPDRGDAVEINHTFVDPSLRGQGVAGQLLQAVADTLRAGGRRAIPTCSYAVRWFEAHPECSDLLA